MNVATVSSKGQIVIPEKLRRKYGITKGTRVSIEEAGDTLVLHPVTREYVGGLVGFLSKGPSLTQALLDERQEDRGREEDQE